MHNDFVSVHGCVHETATCFSILVRTSLVFALMSVPPFDKGLQMQGKVM